MTKNYNHYADDELTSSAKEKGFSNSITNPTLAQLQTWLTEERNTIVLVLKHEALYISADFSVDIDIKDATHALIALEVETFTSYAKALSSGLLNAINNLKQ